MSWPATDDLLREAFRDLPLALAEFCWRLTRLDAAATTDLLGNVQRHPTLVRRIDVEDILAEMVGWYKGTHACLLRSEGVTPPQNDNEPPAEAEGSK